MGAEFFNQLMNSLQNDEREKFEEYFNDVIDIVCFVSNLKFIFPVKTEKLKTVMHKYKKGE